MIEFLKLFMYMHTVLKMMYESYLFIKWNLRTNKQTLLGKKNKILISVDANWIMLQFWFDVIIVDKNTYIM